MTIARTAHPKVNIGLAYVVFFVGILSVMASFDSWVYEFFLLGWFRFQLCLVLLLCAMALLFLRNWALLGVCLILNAPNVMALAPYFIPQNLVPQSASTPTPTTAPSQSSTTTPSTSLRICQINLNSMNANHDKVVAYIKGKNPDLIFVQELTDTWLKELRKALPEYGYAVKITRPDPFGIGILSRLPLDEGRIHYFGNLDYPAVTAVMPWNGLQVKLVNVHPFPLFAPHQLAPHRLQMAGITSAAKDQPVILAGDFNSPAWGFSMRQLLADDQLRSAAYGFGWQPTWPRELQQWGHPEIVISNPLTMFPIDHTLISKEFAARRFEIGPNVGSDHSPLFVELVSK